MNEHLLYGVRATHPQHERRIVAWVGSDFPENGLFSYCTVCAWDSDEIREWAEHLDMVAAFHDDIESATGPEQPKDGDLVATMQYDADGVPKTTVEIAGSQLDVQGRKWPTTELDPQGNPM